MALRHNVLILEFQLNGTFLLQHFKFLFQKMKPSISSPIKAIWKKNWIDEFDPDVNCFSKKKNVILPFENKKRNYNCYVTEC